ncbi:hypothetical protein ABPG72_015334 [Tetrahymena utriculariae]
MQQQQKQQQQLDIEEFQNLNQMAAHPYRQRTRRLFIIVKDCSITLFQRILNGFLRIGAVEDTRKQLPQNNIHKAVIWYKEGVYIWKIKQCIHQMKSSNRRGLQIFISKSTSKITASNFLLFGHELEEEYQQSSQSQSSQQSQQEHQQQKERKRKQNKMTCMDLQIFKENQGWKKKKEEMLSDDSAFIEILIQVNAIQNQEGWIQLNNLMIITKIYQTFYMIFNFLNVIYTNYDDKYHNNISDPGKQAGVQEGNKFLVSFISHAFFWKQASNKMNPQTNYLQSNSVDTVIRNNNKWCQNTFAGKLHIGDSNVTVK